MSSQSSNAMAHNMIPDPTVLSESRICPGCKNSVVTENGGVVVAFGQSYFHIDCFKCAKCHQQVTADTNLLLLSDGSPVCANCSYCCNVCGQPILDEAIMTGDDSYHAHCFNCKVCKKRIEELVFAKTSQGIYCMPCHSERVARSRRHLERKEREKREREKQMVGLGEALTTKGPVAAAAPAAHDVAGTSKTSTPSTDPPSARSGTPRISEFGPTVASPPPMRREASSSAPGDKMTNPHSPQQSQFTTSTASASSNSTSPAGTSATTTTGAVSGAQSSATLQNGRPSSPSTNRETSEHTRSPSNPSANLDMLAVPTNGANQTLQKRRSFDDRPLNVLISQNEMPETSSNSQGALLSPEGGSSSRRAKRQSINPGLVMSYNNLSQDAPQRSRSPSSPSTPQAYTNGFGTSSNGLENGRSRSPLLEQFKRSPPGFTYADNKQSPAVPRMQLDISDSTLHDRHMGRSRSASSSDTLPPQRFGQPTTQQRDRSKSPMRMSFTLDRVPARTSSRTDLRSDTAPPNFSPDGGKRTPQLTSEGRMSPSLNVPNGVSALLRQASFESRKRNSTSSLGQTIELPPPSPNASRATSPAHRVDVPRGVESGTDTDAEAEEEFSSQNGTIRDSLPPLPPPKESKGTKAGLRPPQLKLDSSNVQNGDRYERDDLSQVDSADVSEEYLQEEPVESTSHSTFIAPALPPIRFSMGGADFDDLLKSVGGPEGLKQLDRIVEGKERPDLTATPPPTAVQPTTPTSNAYKPDINADATPMKRREPPVSISQSQHSQAVDGRYPNGRTSLEGVYPRDLPRAAFSRSQPGDPKIGLPPKPRLEDQVYRRERVDSNASLAPNGSSERLPRTHITITPPENAPLSISRPDTSDLVRRRLQEALSESTDRGAPYVKLDAEFIGAIIMLLDQRKEEFLDMKRKLDGMKRASQQYVEGLTVAQTEYDKELKARRDAEAEVTRLRVLLSSQAVRLKAMSGEAKKQEAKKQLSQEMSDSLSSLEQDLSKLKVERDMALAEVEELSASKSSSTIAIGDNNQRISRALSVRFDNIKTQYQSDLLPLTARKEALFREITELRASRDAYLEETTMLSARNEELAQLHAQYLRRLDTASDGSHEFQREPSLDKGRPLNLSSSVTSSTTAFSEESTESRFVKVMKPDAIENVPQPKAKFKWPGSRSQPQSSKENHAPNLSESSKPKVRIEHNFQQVNGLRVARCDHCGDKMWGSIMRCTACNISVHHRCSPQVHLSCSQNANGSKSELSPPLQAGPSMFGRELVEQVRADSRDEERLVPVIVEKCIDAVDTLALDYEGIYRKSGGSGQSKVITQLFERGDYASFDLRDNDRFNDICSVTSVLKTYFRSLPDPLLTFNLHEKFIYAASMKDPATKGTMFTDAIAELPREHYYTTRALMLHLHRIYERSETNLMHARNLGVVFGPTLMRSRDPNAEFSDMAGKALTVEWLVENAPTVFEQTNAS